MSPSFANERPGVEHLLGLGDEVEAEVELGERAVEGERVGLGLDGLRVLVEGALLVVHVEEDLGELEVRRAVVVAVADVRVELDGLLERRLCVGPARRALHGLTRHREAVLEVVEGVLRRELLSLRACRGDLVPRLFLGVRERELPEDAVVGRIEVRRLLVLRDGGIDVRRLRLVALVGEVHGFDVVAAASANTDRTSNDGQNHRVPSTLFMAAE